jgi:hypothetical protein
MSTEATSGKTSPRKSLRLAFTLNFMVPGVGQLYLGQTGLGVIYLTSFGSIFVTMFTLFLRAYAKYLELSTSGDILEGDNLEQLSHVFPARWLVGLTVVALIIYVASMASLRLPRGRSSHSSHI